MKKKKKESRLTRLRSFNQDAGRAFIQAVSDEIQFLRQHPKKLVRILVEVILVSFIAFAFAIYFDPSINLIPEPLNVVVFIFLILVYLYTHFILHLPTD
jgi:RsiW-degrading membrane proteinase PrsW (M82 family)